MPVFKGSAVAIVTPMKANGEVNYEKLGELIEMQIAGETDAIVICGTTGESSTLSHEEHIDVIRYCVEKVAKRVPVIAAPIPRRQPSICLRKRKSVERTRCCWYRPITIRLLRRA